MTTRIWLYLIAAWLLIMLAWPLLAQIPMPQTAQIIVTPSDTNQIHLLIGIAPVPGAAKYRLTSWDALMRTNTTTVTASCLYTNWNTNQPFSFSAVSVASNGVAGSNMPPWAVVVWPYRYHIMALCYCTNLNSPKWSLFTGPLPMIFTNNIPANWPPQFWLAWRNTTNF